MHRYQFRNADLFSAGCIFDHQSADADYLGTQLPGNLH